jgi:hypothetical protein
MQQGANQALRDRFLLRHHQTSTARPKNTRVEVATQAGPVKEQEGAVEMDRPVE